MTLRQAMLIMGKSELHGYPCETVRDGDVWGVSINLGYPKIVWTVEHAEEILARQINNF